MKFAILCLPHYKHIKQRIIDQMSSLEHTFYIFEEQKKESGLAGGLDALDFSENIKPIVLPDIDFDSLLSSLKGVNVDRIISFSDRGMVLAAKLREHFGIPGNKVESEYYAVDKGKMREKLHRAKLTKLDYRVTTLDKLLEDVPGMSLPVVVKPTDLGASLCVELVTEEDGYVQYLERCRKNPVFNQGNVIVEQYLPGDEFSVEGMVVGGKVYFFGITESHTSGEPYFIGVGHDFYAEHKDATEIYGYTKRLLSCLGFNDCPFHVELKRSEDTFEVIEVHTRYAGAMVMELVDEALGINCFSLYCEMLVQPGYQFKKNTVRPVCSQKLLCSSGGLIEEISLGNSVVEDDRLLSYSLDFSKGDSVPHDVIPLHYVGYVNYWSDDVGKADQFRGQIDKGFNISCQN